MDIGLGVAVTHPCLVLPDITFVLEWSLPVFSLIRNLEGQVSVEHISTFPEDSVEPGPWLEVQGCELNNHRMSSALVPATGPVALV